MKILTYPSPELRKKAEPVTKQMFETAEFQAKLRELKELAKEDGLGVASTQVGWGVSLFISNVDKNLKKLDDPKVYLNPKITYSSKKLIGAVEGCLSVPRLSLEIERPDQIFWEYEDTSFAKYTAVENYTDTDAGYFIRLVQHEIDHLSGILFLDYASPAQKILIKKWKNQLENAKQL